MIKKIIRSNGYTNNEHTLWFRYEDGWIQTVLYIFATGFFRKKYTISVIDKKIKDTPTYMEIRKSLGDEFKMTQKEKKLCAQVLIAENFLKRTVELTKKMSKAYKKGKK